VHDDGPVVFESRWCLSYLRGPLTRQQIKTLMDARRAGAASSAPTGVTPSAAQAPSQSKVAESAPSRPVLPPEIPQYFIPARAAGGLTYIPMLIGLSKVYFQDTKLGIDEDVAVNLLAPIGSGPVPIDWDHATDVEFTEKDVEKEPAGAGRFEALPSEASKAKSYEAWKKALGDALYRSRTLDLLRCASLKEVSKPNETEREFRARLAQVARETRDAQAEKLRTKYAPKVQVLQDRLRRAQQALEVQKEQSSSAKIGTAISFGAAILGAFMGRKLASASNIGKAASAAKSVGRASKESADVGRAEETVEAVQAQLQALEAQFQEELSAASDRIDPATEELEHLSLKPKKTNISVRAVVLAWAPHTTAADGSLTPAW